MFLFNGLFDGFFLFLGLFLRSLGFLFLLAFFQHVLEHFKLGGQLFGQIAFRVRRDADGLDSHMIPNPKLKEQVHEKDNCRFPRKEK